MENAEVARVLAEIADLLELTGGNAFKVRAYRKAAQVARRGWLEAKDVLNTLPLAELRRRLTRGGSTARSAPGR